MVARFVSGRQRHWKKPGQVARIVFEPRGNIIGSGAYGAVFVGRMRFAGKNSKWKRVAIKKFEHPLNDKTAAQYQRIICDLRKGGVRLPKMAMVKLPNGEWVQVSQLFGSTKKMSKLAKFVEAESTQHGRMEAAIELTKVANAGYAPYADLLAMLKKHPKGAVPIDIDSICIHQYHFGSASAVSRARYLAQAIEHVAEQATNAEYKEICDAAIKAASPAMKKELASALPYFPRTK